MLTLSRCNSRLMTMLPSATTSTPCRLPLARHPSTLASFKADLRADLVSLLGTYDGSSPNKLKVDMLDWEPWAMKQAIIGSVLILVGWLVTFRAPARFASRLLLTHMSDTSERTRLDRIWDGPWLDPRGRIGTPFEVQSMDSAAEMVGCGRLGFAVDPASAKTDAEHEDPDYDPLASPGADPDSETWGLGAPGSSAAGVGCTDGLLAT